MNELALKQNISFLGQKGLVRQSEKGFIRCIEHEVELSFRSNHFWKLATKKKDSDGNWVEEIAYKLTAEGYEYLNKFAGLRVVNEPTFELNGQVFTNPAILLDETNRKQAVYYKLTLYGYGPSGTLEFSPVLIHYNATDEFISSLISKIQYNSNMGQMIAKDDFPEYKKEHKFAMFFPTDQIGDMILGIAADVSHTEFLKLRGVHQEKINNLEKKIQTVAKRNAFRKHSATAVYSVYPEKKYDANGKFIDLIHKEKIIQWIDVDLNEELKQLDDYVKRANVVVENYKDIEPDKDDLEEGIQEEFVEVAVEFDAETDAEEKEKLVKWIQKGIKRIPFAYALPSNWESLSIIELEAFKSDIEKKEEKLC